MASKGGSWKSGGFAPAAGSKSGGGNTSNPSGMSAQEGQQIVAKVLEKEAALRQDTSIGGNAPRLRIVAESLKKDTVKKDIRDGVYSLNVLEQLAMPTLAKGPFGRAADWAVSQAYSKLTATQKNKLAKQRQSVFVDGDFQHPGMKAVQKDILARRERILANRTRPWFG